MNAVITGANGFIGSNLARRLLRDGWGAAGIVRKTSDLTFLDGLGFRLSDMGLEDTDAIARAFDGADVVFHCASRTSDWGPMEVFRKSNIDATKNVMRAASAAGVRRVVYVGTVAVYGFLGNVDTDEAAPKRPALLPYCVTKLEAERQVEKIARDEGLEYVIVRPGIVFGPRDRVTTIGLYKFLLAGKFAYINGGRPLTCPTYVENLVDALVLAGEREEAACGDFIITDGLRITWREYVTKTCEALGAPMPRHSLPAGPVYAAAVAAESVYRLFGAKNPPAITRYRISLVRNDFHFSIGKARRRLGFEPKVDLEEAIRRTAEWYRGECPKTP
jgi:nucleoside-diphosphate-sugar epimerase